MPDSIKNSMTVAVLGAGPAGLFAARELAQAGVQVALINRDIKAGGLAEYGIYPDKHKMKEGLRRQFRQVLEEPNIHYFGHVKIGTKSAITLDEIRAMGFDAVLVTVGAQGTKWLGLPGEDLEGVYHAKDLVYHYNKLPPFSEQKFPIGQHVVCIGVGNVMLDIAHWVVRALKVDELIAIARRGPADVKFTKKEMETVIANLDVEALNTEIERTASLLKKMNQDPEEAKAFILAAQDHAEPKISDTNFKLEFLTSPHRIVGDERGRVNGLEVEETTLELRDDGRTRAVGLDKTHVIPCDTVVFCIGDRVDADFGLPLDKWGDFAKAPKPRFPQEDNSYEAYDPEKDAAIEGVFVAGWSREASSGLVGVARKDGTNGAKAVIAYLEDKPASKAEAIKALKTRVNSLDTPVVHKADLEKLEAIEAKEAEKRGLEEFKFDSDEEMLAAIEPQPEKA